MLGAILGGVLTAMFGGRRRRVRNVVPNAPKPVPRPAEQARTQRQFDAWARRAGLAHDDDARGYRGRMAGHEVLVRPGLDGSSAIGVEVEITIEHDEPAMFLFTPKRRTDPDAKSDVGEALVPLFDDATLAALRSIAVIKEGVRLGFQPLTGPDDVQLAIDASIRAVEERLRARPRENAYR
jgi:hypothetical protein